MIVVAGQTYIVSRSIGIDYPALLTAEDPLRAAVLRRRLGSGVLCAFCRQLLPVVARIIRPLPIPIERETEKRSRRR